MLHWRVESADVNNVRAPNLELNCIAWIHLISFGYTLRTLFENCKKRSLFPMEMNQKTFHKQRTDGSLATRNQFL